MQEEPSNIKSHAAAVYSSSDDSDSTDEGVVSNGSCARLQSMIKSKEAVKLFELDSKVGLTGQLCHWSFPCLFDEDSTRFYVWLGDVTIDKFTKSIFLNLVAFAEKTGASKMILIQNRDHCQKDEFRKLFTVLDAHRVGKSGMTKMLNEQKLQEYIENFALYMIDLI